MKYNSLIKVGVAIIIASMILYASTSILRSPVVTASQPDYPSVYRTANKIAEDKLAQLVETRHWSHTNENGCDFSCRIEGYTGSWIGENLYHGTCDVINAYKLWNLSPAHKHVLQHKHDFVIEKWEQVADNECYAVYINGQW